MAIQTKQYEVSFDRRMTTDPSKPEEVNVVQVVEKNGERSVERFFINGVDEFDALAFDIGSAILERFGIIKKTA
jgi:hypothetical protein